MVIFDYKKHSSRVILKLITTIAVMNMTACVPLSDALQTQLPTPEKETEKGSTSILNTQYQSFYVSNHLLLYRDLSDPEKTIEDNQTVAPTTEPHEQTPEMVTNHADLYSFAFTGNKVQSQLLQTDSSNKLDTTSEELWSKTRLTNAQ